MFNERISVLYQTRYCDQEEISIAVCTHRSIKVLEFPYSMNSYENSKQIYTLTTLYSKVIACGLNLFVISESRRNFMFKKCPEPSENKVVLPKMLDKRTDFCVCSLMQKVYVIGGCSKIQNYSINLCICYDIKSNKWTYIASMIESRQNSSCAVFEGKIVVTGGLYMENFSHRELNCSESYCFYENKWKKFPNLMAKRCNHATVSMGNKLFVIGGNYENNGEVFDSVTNKFVIIENTPGTNHLINAFSIGYKIYVFYQNFNFNYRRENKNYMFTLCYNDQENAFIKDSKLALDSRVISCAKIFKK